MEGREAEEGGAAKKRQPLNPKAKPPLHSLKQGGLVSSGRTGTSLRAAHCSIGLAAAVGDSVSNRAARLAGQTSKTS